MQRQAATKFLRNRLDEFGLSTWGIRLTVDLTKPFLGMCSHKDRCIILNAHHIDTHPEVEVIDTINHEIAHAIVGPEHGHDIVWMDKAKELGANPIPCVAFGLNENAIDAIRSGADLEISFVEKKVEYTYREPSYKVVRLQDKCPYCGKVAKEKSRVEVKTSEGYKYVITLECNHIIFKNSDSKSPFEDFVFDINPDNPNCKHDWKNTICLDCGAKRLFKFQVEGCRALEKANGRFALFHEMGLGKTVMPLVYLRYNPLVRPFLWITKSSPKFQHAKEIVRLLGKSEFPQVLMSGKDKLIPGMNILASYDIFRRMDIQMFHDHGFKSVVIDECQAIKNPDSTRTGLIRQIVRNIPSIIPTSGTPWKNRGSEFFVVLNMLDPKLFYSYKAFKQEWVDTYWEGAKEKEGGIKNPEKFKAHIAHLALRRERTEVMPELPLVSRKKLFCEVEEHARKVYNDEATALQKVYNAFALEGKEESFEAKREYQKNLIIMRQIVGISKVPTTVEFLKDFLEETDRKIVCFVHHKACGEMIYQQMTTWCAENNLAQPMRLTADLSAEERFHVQEKFNGPGVRLLIASTLASGEGLNLQSCSDCVMHERQWNPANEEQAEGRFIRIGQMAQSVDATYVLADKTVDTDFDGIVERKRTFFHKAMNKGEMPVWNEGDLMMNLVKSIVNQKEK